MWRKNYLLEGHVGETVFYTLRPNNKDHEMNPNYQVKADQQLYLFVHNGHNEEEHCNKDSILSELFLQIQHQFLMQTLKNLHSGTIYGF